MAERQKYVCPICKKGVTTSKKYARHVMGHAGHKYTVCDNCGIRKRNPDKTDWATKHACLLNNRPHSVNVFTVTEEALKGMLIGVCEVIPSHVPGWVPPAPAVIPAPVLPVPGGAEGGAEEEEDEGDMEEEPESEDEGDMEEEPEGEPDMEEAGEVVEPWSPPGSQGNSFSSEYPEGEEDNPELPPPADEAPPRDSDPEPLADVRDGPRQPTLAIGECGDMTGPSLDWRMRYPVDTSLDQPNIRQMVHMYVPSPQAAVVRDPLGERMLRVPAVHHRTGTHVVLAAPAYIQNAGLIFRDCHEFDPVPVNVPSRAGWLGDDGVYVRVMTAATWYHPL